MNESNQYRLKTLDSSFKGVFFDYRAKTLHQNEINHLNFTFKICMEHVLPSFVVSYLRKDHFLVSEINTKIEELQSNGLLSFWIKKYTNYKHSKISNLNIQPSKLKPDHLRGAFQVLAYGLSIAAMSFVFEFIFKMTMNLLKVLTLFNC